MKAGQLFEKALRTARIDLKPGIKMHVSVKGTGTHLKLIVSKSPVTEFEKSILERSKKYSIEKLQPYKPDLTLGEKIQCLRKANKLTLEELSSKTGISKGSLCSIEKNNRSVGLSVLKKIAEALEISISLLLE